MKNEDKILPVDKNTLKSIAVIGPNADSRAALIGNYFGTASEYVTVLEGIREAVNEDTRIYYAEGCPIYNEKASVLGEKYDRFAEAISAAERSDLVVMCLGLDADLEGEEGDTGNEFASGDKPNLDLPGLQQELLERIHKTGKPIILVLLSGSALAVNWADENIPAIIQGWYPGSQGGRAIASLIFGDYSPSGRLPVTFYRSTEELPDFRDYSMENRTYRYMKQEALYPFGYGLSYSKFEYSNLSLDQTNIDLGQDVNVSVVVKNVGNYEADEVVQLYLKDVEASVRVPNWELKGVKRISLKPGEEVKLDFTVTARQMALIDNDGRCVLEPGLFELFVGGSQPDSRSEKLTGQKVLKAEFTVSGEAKEIDY